MRVAIFSDVHGNLNALEAVLVAIKEKAPDLIVFAGDLCLGGAYPSECVALLRAESIAAIEGYTDTLLNNDPLLDTNLEQARKRHEPFDDNLRDWTWAALTPADRAWLRTLPAQRRVSPTTFPQDDLFVVHANPKNMVTAILPDEASQEAIWNEVRQPNSGSEMRHLLSDLFVGVLAYGHLHIPGSRHWQHLHLANISSVSLAQDGDPRAKYGLLTWERRAGWRLEQQYVTYNIEAEVEALAQKQPPAWSQLADSLRSGNLQKLPDLYPEPISGHISAMTVVS